MVIDPRNLAEARQRTQRNLIFSTRISQIDTVKKRNFIFLNYRYKQGHRFWLGIAKSRMFPFLPLKDCELSKVSQEFPYLLTTNIMIILIKAIKAAIAAQIHDHFA
jgi:hypothetical protein